MKTILASLLLLLIINQPIWAQITQADVEAEIENQVTELPDYDSAFKTTQQDANDIYAYILYAIDQQADPMVIADATAYLDAAYGYMAQGNEQVSFASGNQRIGLQKTATGMLYYLSDNWEDAYDEMVDANYYLDLAQQQASNGIGHLNNAETNLYAAYAVLDSYFN